jgi:hypothetical protein
MFIKIKTEKGQKIQKLNPVKSANHNKDFLLSLGYMLKAFDMIQAV